LHDLRSENEAIREKLKTEVVMTPAPQEPQGRWPEEKLSREERHELLLLRGQVQPLRRQVQELSAQVEHEETNAAQKRAAQTLRTDMLERQTIMQGTMSFHRSEAAIALRERGSALGQRLHAYLEANNGSLPDDLSKLGANASSEKTNDDEFELMRSGAVPADDEASTLVARQKLPTLMPNGRLSRLYVLANGNVMFGMLATNGDWTRFEERTQDRLVAKQSQSP
jgi:hypothetical protein